MVIISDIIGIAVPFENKYTIKKNAFIRLSNNGGVQ